MRLVKSILAAFLMFSLVGCSQAVDTSTVEKETETVAEENEPAGISGTFSGTAKGYGGDVTVNLTFEDGKLVDVTGEAPNETTGKGDLALAEMIPAMKEAGSIAVDTYSGATVTSTAIKKAANSALQASGVEDVTAFGGEAPKENTGCNLDLDSINEWLNTSADLGEGTMGNAVAIIPISHINGPREETDFYAFVNFKYRSEGIKSYIKYQITYLSCTCRDANVNYWMTAYVELSLPKSKDINDSEITFLSFDQDSTGHYLAGFWGDSNPTPAGNTYEEFKEQYIPFFVGKNYEYIQKLSVVEDIDAADYASGEGRSEYKLDTFSGSSVSTNNIIRMLNALFKYHATDKYFQN